MKIKTLIRGRRRLCCLCQQRKSPGFQMPPLGVPAVSTIGENFICLDCDFDSLNGYMEFHAENEAEMIKVVADAWSEDTSGLDIPARLAPLVREIVGLKKALRELRYSRKIRDLCRDSQARADGLPPPGAEVIPFKPRTLKALTPQQSE
jgi:hypothetical protein